MLNIVEDENWSKTSRKQKLQPTSALSPSARTSPDANIAGGSTVNARKQHKQEITAFIDDPLAGVADPMDLLEKLDKQQAKREKLKKGQRIIGAPSKREVYRTTMSAKERREEEQQKKRTERDRRLEKNAVTKLHFAVPFDASEQKKKTVSVVQAQHETLQQVAKQLTCDNLRSAIAAARKKFAKNESLVLREVASFLEEFLYNSTWTLTYVVEEPLCFLDNAVCDVLTNFLKGLQLESCKELVQFAFDSIYSEKGGEYGNTRNVGLKMLLQLLAKQSPQLIVDAVSEKFPHGEKLRGTALKNFVWLLGQVNLEALDTHLALRIYLRLFLPCVGQEASRDKDFTELLLQLITAIKGKIVANVESVVSREQLVEMQALYYNQEESDNSSSALQHVFETVMRSVQTPAYFETLFKQVKRGDKSQQNEDTMEMLKNMLSHSPSEVTALWTTLMVNNAKQSTELLEYLQQVDVPVAICSQVVNALQQQETLLKQQPKKKQREANELSEALQGFVDHAKQIEKEEQSFSFSFIRTILLVLVVIVIAAAIGLGVWFGGQKI